MASHNFACLCVCVWDPFLLSSFLVFQFSLEDHHHARKLRLWSLLGLFVMPVLKVLANEILLCVLASRLLVKSFLEFQTSLRKWSGVTWRKEGKVWSICFPGTKQLLLVTGICFWQDLTNQAFVNISIVVLVCCWCLSPADFARKSRQELWEILHEEKRTGSCEWAGSVTNPSLSPSL
jgi:hypothetical protein